MNSNDINVLKLYKLESAYPNTDTIKRGLRGQEIDENMLFLHGEQIKSIEFKDGNMVINRINGSVEKIEIPKLNDSKFELNEDGNIVVSGPSGEKTEIPGVVTEKNINVATGKGLNGNGAKSSPLSLDNAYISGNLGSVNKAFIEEKYIIDCIDGETDDDMLKRSISEINDILEKDPESFERMKIEDGDRFVFIHKFRICPEALVDSDSYCQKANEYIISDGKSIRRMVNGDEFTLVGNGHIPNTKYLLENCLDNPLIEASIKVNPLDKMLSINKNSYIESTLSIKKTVRDGNPYIQLIGRNGELISEIDAYEFILDSFLKDVEASDGKLNFKFSAVGESGKLEEKIISIDIKGLIGDVSDPAIKKIEALEKNVEQLKVDLSAKIKEIEELVACINDSAIRKIIPIDNQIKVEDVSYTEEGSSENPVKGVRIGFADDTYFIAGE